MSSGFGRSRVKGGAMAKAIELILHRFQIFLIQIRTTRTIPMTMNAILFIFLLPFQKQKNRVTNSLWQLGSVRWKPMGLPPSHGFPLSWHHLSEMYGSTLNRPVKPVVIPYANSLRPSAIVHPGVAQRLRRGDIALYSAHGVIRAGMSPQALT
jgi:hypothetical protein